MSQRLIAVTGATGFVGGATARLLADAGARVRLVVRDPSRAPAGLGEVAAAGYGDAAAARAALRGVDVLLMVSAAESADRLMQHRTFVSAAAAAGVGHIVYTSFLGAAPDATFTLARDHWATEEHLRAAGPSWTVLRDSFYLDFLPALADESGVIRGPAGDGRVGAVARLDVARCAAAVLSEPAAHAGQRYDVTGPEALGLADAARIITEVTGRPTTYEQETVEDAYASRQRYDAPPWQLDAWVSTYTAIAAGELDLVSDCVEQITGNAPMSLARLLDTRND